MNKIEELNGLIAAYNETAKPADRILAIQQLSVLGMSEPQLDEWIKELRDAGFSPRKGVSTKLYSNLSN